MLLSRKKIILLKNYPQVSSKFLLKWYLHADYFILPSFPHTTISYIARVHTAAGVDFQRVIPLILFLPIVCLFPTLRLICILNFPLLIINVYNFSSLLPYIWTNCAFLLRLFLPFCKCLFYSAWFIIITFSFLFLLIRSNSSSSYSLLRATRTAISSFCWAFSRGISC